MLKIILYLRFSVAAIFKSNAPALRISALVVLTHFHYLKCCFFKDNKGRIVSNEVGLAVLDLDATAHRIIEPTCYTRFLKKNILRENN
ncbi:hypothetical protein TSAR_006814 [Trichomalopsis sarcophagae]|uniref:Uncharacterized protein n=1 Tax=Trichomalopsis sarcophagae TaxID=543379 RepID=A0A232F2J7_9HYME|nr:hypothetical protein TSAR_006814 [Trichomalopsis sarcophagae]